MEYIENINLLQFEENYEGRILVASPTLNGTPFEKSLIYIFSHDANGARGVIFNEEVGILSAIDIITAGNEAGDKEGVAVKKIKAPKQYSVLYGGPVYPDSFLILSMNKRQEKEFDKLPRLTVFIEIKDFLINVVMGKEKSKFLLFKGITAWDEGQLESEVYENSWIVADVSKELLFSRKIKYKWHYIVDKLGLTDNFKNIVSYHGCA